MTSFPAPANEVIQDGDRKRKGRHFAPRAAMGVEKPAPGPGWRHFRPRHLGSKMARSEMTSGGRRDVLQTSAPSMSPVEVWLYWKHLIISLTQTLSKWLSELPACHYGEVDQSAHVESCEKPSTSASTYSTFFYFIFIFFFNCTLQQPRIVVQYSVIVGRNLENNLTPTMTILFWFSWILSTKRPWQSSTRTRAVWQRSNGADADHRVLWFFTSSVTLSCRPTQLR